MVFMGFTTMDNYVGLNKCFSDDLYDSSTKSLRMAGIVAKMPKLLQIGVAKLMEKLVNLPVPSK